MPHSLNQRIEQVQRTASQLLWLYGFSRFAAATVVVVAGLGALDYLLRLHHPAARWLLSILVLALIAAAFIKLAWPALSYQQNRVATARRVEARFPQLGEQLSSAIAFLQQPVDDPTAGSPGLRLAVIAEAEAHSAHLDFAAVLDSSPIRRAVTIAAACCGAAALFVIANPLLGTLSVSRLATPWRDQPWPRRHELAVVDPPRRIAAGSDLEIAVIDSRGRLPDSVELLLRHDSPSGTRTVTHEMKPLGEQMIFRIDNVTHNFAFRARGGDDDTMPWFEVNVVEPPKLIDLKVIVDPPEYTGLPPQMGGRVVKGLTGSKLRILGRLDKAIRSAAAHSQDPDFALPAAEVAADGLSFTAPSTDSQWLLERSGTLWFELADSQGLVLARDIRLELHAITDAPPTITWEAPSDPAVTTAQAVLPVKGLVKDDVAVRKIELRYLRSGSDGEQVVELFAASPDKSPARPPELSAPQGTSSIFDGETRTFDYHFDLAKIADLAPGDELTARITAEDNKQESTTTVVRRVTIITAEQLSAWIATGQGAILNQLAEALRLARQVREQTSAVENQLSSAEQLSANDLSRLQGIEHHQRQVQQLLDGSNQGVEGQLAALLEQLAANRLAGHAVAQRLNELLNNVGGLNRQSLPKVAESLAAAFKAAREAVEKSSPDAAPAPKDVAESLSAAGGTQEEVIQFLERTLGTLSEWDNFSRLAREVGQIRTEEQRLANVTEDLKLKTIASVAESSPAPLAAARLLSERQLDLARSLDKLQSRMEDMLARLGASEPTSGTLPFALDTARRLAIGGKMRQAAGHLSEFRLGDGYQMEQVVLQALEKLQTALSASPPESLTGGPPTNRTDNEQEPTSPPGSPRDTERIVAELQRLLRLQQDINHRTSAKEAIKASTNTLTTERELELDALAKEQRQLADALQDLVRETDQQREATQ